MAVHPTPVLNNLPLRYFLRSENWDRKGYFTWEVIRFLHSYFMGSKNQTPKEATFIREGYFIFEDVIFCGVYLSGLGVPSGPSASFLRTQANLHFARKRKL